MDKEEVRARKLKAAKFGPAPDTSTSCRQCAHINLCCTACKLIEVYLRTPSHTAACRHWQEPQKGPTPYDIRHGQ